MRKLICLSLLLLAACGNAEEERKKLAALQTQADEALTKAKHELQLKVDDAEKQLADLKTQAADSKTKLDECMSKAQAGADEQGKAAEAALGKARQAFKEEGRLELSNANKDLNDAAAKSAKAPAKAKAAFQKALQPVAAQQKAIAADLAAYDTATLDSFKTVKGKLEHDLAVYKATIRSAKAKVP